MREPHESLLTGKLVGELSADSPYRGTSRLLIQLNPRPMAMMENATRLLNWVHTVNPPAGTVVIVNAMAVSGLPLDMKAMSPWMRGRYQDAYNHLIEGLFQRGCRLELTGKTPAWVGTRHPEPPCGADICGGLDTSVYYGQTGVEGYRLFAWTEGALHIQEDGKVIQYQADKELIVNDRYHALMLSIRDYVTKSGLPGVVIGLSGGIDSALVTALAVDALGADKVKVAMLPSRFTRELSFEVAHAFLKSWQVEHVTLSIEPLFEAALTTLGEAWGQRTWDVTEENLQARIRGMLLMGLANESGRLLLCTSNKSEAAMGYGTLYGDITGGWAPLIDIWKSEIVSLCLARNAWAGKEMIPETLIYRAPSAELKADQTDQDTLPAYDVIEKVVTRFLEEVPVYDIKAELAESGQGDATVVDAILRRLFQNQFKRNQGIPGPMLSATPLTLLKAYPGTAWPY